MAVSGSADQGLHMVGTNLDRRISLDIRAHDSGSAQNSCAMIEWGGILGFFRRSSQICFERKGASYRGDLTGPRDIHLTWVNTNDAS